MMLRPRRWWTPVLVVLGVVIALIVIWSGSTENADVDSDPIRQVQVMRTAFVLLTSAALLLAWLSFFSGLSRSARLTTWCGLIATAVCFLLLFRYRGVSGDLVPIFELRWATNETTPTTDRVGQPDVADVGDAARDYPQFLGPHRNATVTGVSLETDWATRPPRPVWRRPVGTAWSSFAVSGNAAVTQEQRGEQEAVVRYDLRTGDEEWVSVEPAHYSNPISGEGPRATPTIANGFVFTVGGTGILSSLDLRTGRRIWSRNFIADNSGRPPDWGISCSPLAIDGMVVVCAGGEDEKSLVAYDQESGEIVWQSGSDRAAYASPFVTTLAGVRQIIIFNHASVAGHDPANGNILWAHPWPARQPNVAQPVPIPGNRILLSAGYGVGAKLLAVHRLPNGTLEATEVWESLGLKAKFANFVVHEGFAYGLDDGILVCLETATGERLWKQGRYGHGQMILVEDLLLVQTEQGEIVLIEPNPRELRELSRFRVFEGKLWNSPTLIERYLLVRNDREAALYELPLDE